MNTSTAELRPLPSPNDPVVAIIVAMIVGVVLFALVATAREPRQRTLRLLFLYLAYGVLEIIVKRLAHFSWYLYPIRFGLFFAILISWMGSSDKRRLPFANVPLSSLLGGYLALAAIQIFNPIQANPLVGVLGWLSDFAFAAFYFIAFDLLDDAKSLRRFLYVTAALGVASALMCFAEQWYGPDELMRLYPTFVHLLYFTPTGVVHRPVMLSPYSEVFAIAAMLGLIESRRGSWVFWAIGIGLCIVANLLHAVRIAWFTGLAIVALLALLNRRRRFMNAVLIAASIALAVDVGMTVTDGQIAESLNSATTPVRTFQEKRLWGVQAIPLMVSMYPFGVGVGEASPGVRFLDSADLPGFGSAHNYLADLAGQMSILGPILLMLFSGRVLLTVARSIRTDKSAEWRSQVVVPFAIFGALAVSLVGGGGLGGYPVSDYFWLSAGAAMGLTFARQRQTVRARESAAARPYAGPTLVPRRAMSQRRSTI